MLNEKIIDIQTGKETIRNYTAAAIAEAEAEVAEANKRAVLVAKAASDKAALLEKLGITADEALLLLA
jgi:hypothetical protein